MLRCDWPGVAADRGSLWSVEKGCGAGSTERDSGEEAHSDGDSEDTDFLPDTEDRGIEAERLTARGEAGSRVLADVRHGVLLQLAGHVSPQRRCPAAGCRRAPRLLAVLPPLLHRHLLPARPEQQPSARLRRLLRPRVRPHGALVAHALLVTLLRHLMQKFL